MRIALINSVCDFGSTGRICADLAAAIQANDDEAIILYGRGQSDNPAARKIGSQAEVYKHVLQTRFYDRHGLASSHATKEAIRILEYYKPDCIHLHNLHGYYLNYEILFSWLKKQNIPVVWTLHDCWPYTGHCAYPVDSCNKWMEGCHSCKLKRSYPKSIFCDRSEQNYEQKMSATKAYREGIRHASMVLRHLEDDLNFDQEISNQLFRLYTYCERALARATYKEDPELFDRVEKVMGELREAFVAVAAEDTSAPLMANTQKYVAGYTYGRTDVKEMAVNFDISRGFLA